VTPLLPVYNCTGTGTWYRWCRCRYLETYSEYSVELTALPLYPDSSCSDMLSGLQSEAELLRRCKRRLDAQLSNLKQDEQELRLKIRRESATPASTGLALTASAATSSTLLPPPPALLPTNRLVWRSAGQTVSSSDLGATDFRAGAGSEWGTMAAMSSATTAYASSSWNHGEGGGGDNFDDGHGAGQDSSDDEDDAESLRLRLLVVRERRKASQACNSSHQQPQQAQQQAQQLIARAQDQLLSQIGGDASRWVSAEEQPSWSLMGSNFDSNS
jgi:hypothetical protein